MKVSQRAQSITPFLAMEFGKHAAELEAAGHRVIKLNLGEPDFGAPPTVLAELQRVVSQCNLPYTGALGLPALREAIASFYQSQHGVHVGPERIVVTAGASAALLLVTAALVDPGDEVLVGDPSYPCNRQFLSGFGANVRLVPTDAASRFQLDLAAVQRHWSARTRGLMLATPSNPTGTSVPDALVPVMERLAQNYYICASTPAQLAAMACFTPEALAVCEARRVEFAARRALVLQGLAHAGLSVPVQPDGAFYVYIDVRHTGLNSMQFCQRALQEAHVALTPGHDFGPSSGAAHVRLSYAASRDDLQECLVRLAAFFAKLAPQP